jgi:C4-dicarboxylate-binding protein DctP
MRRLQTGVVDGSENTPSNMYAQRHHEVRKYIAKKENDDALEAIRQSGRSEVIALTPVQKAAWKKALVAVHEDNEGRVGKDTIEAVCEQTGLKP